MPGHRSDTVAFRYQAPIDHWIAELKFHNKLQHAKVLGILFSEKLKQRKTLPELIIPIPLHTHRVCKRVFNQALEIASPISRRLGIPLDIKSLKRIHHTKPQSELTEKERELNLVDAFRCIKPIRAKYIALFDDMMTTGETTNAAYQILKQSGIANIEMWYCSKTTLSSFSSRLEGLSPSLHTLPLPS